MLSVKSWGKKKQGAGGVWDVYVGEDIQSDGVYLPKSLLYVVEPCLPGDG